MSGLRTYPRSPGGACAPVLLFAALLLPVACSQDTPDSAGPTPAQQAEAATLAAEYQAARAQGNWTGAAAIGERLRQKYPDSAQAGVVAASLAEVQGKADALRERVRLEGLWTYQAVPVGKGLQRSASIDSRSAAVAEDEPAPPADAQLVLRDHPAWGRSAYLLLHERAFRCGSPCAMQIAFDDAAATRWTGKQADSGKGPALFVNDEARFLAALEQAAQLRITLPKDSGRLKSLRFDVAGFRRPRFESAKPTPTP